MFSGHTGAVRCGQFTPDGKAVVTGGGEGDATLKIWDPKSGSCTGTVQGHGFHEAGALALHPQIRESSQQRVHHSTFVAPRMPAVVLDSHFDEQSKSNLTIGFGARNGVCWC